MGCVVYNKTPNLCYMFLVDIVIPAGGFKYVPYDWDKDRKYFEPHARLGRIWPLQWPKSLDNIKPEAAREFEKAHAAGEFKYEWEQEPVPEPEPVPDPVPEPEPDTDPEPDPEPEPSEPEDVGGEGVSGNTEPADEQPTPEEDAPADASEPGDGAEAQTLGIQAATASTKRTRKKS